MYVTRMNHVVIIQTIRSYTGLKFLVTTATYVISKKRYRINELEYSGTSRHKNKVVEIFWLKYDLVFFGTILNFQKTIPVQWWILPSTKYYLPQSLKSREKLATTPVIINPFSTNVRDGFRVSQVSRWWLTSFSTTNTKSKLNGSYALKR